MTNTSTSYINEQEYLDYIKSPADIGQFGDVVTDAIAAASRDIDGYCDRSFYSITETRFLSGDLNADAGFYLLTVPDIADITDIEVLSDENNLGTYSTVWTSDVDFLAEPVNRLRHGVIWPYTELRSINGRQWPVRMLPWQRPTIKITTTWGWPALPDAVKQATKIAVAANVKLGEAALGVAGYGEYGAIRVREIPQIAKLLGTYRSGGAFGIA